MRHSGLFRPEETVCKANICLTIFRVLDFLIINRIPPLSLRCICFVQDSCINGEMLELQNHAVRRLLTTQSLSLLLPFSGTSALSGLCSLFGGPAVCAACCLSQPL